MNLNLIKDIRNAYSNLNPGAVRELAYRNLSVGVLASTEEAYAAIRNFLKPAGAGADLTVEPVSESAPAGNFDLLVAETDYPHPASAFVFQPRNPEWMIEHLLDERPELEVAIARNLPAFREAVISRIIQRTARENALFAVVTALPNVVPNFLELPWVVGEFATDTAFLTINQIRMAFLLAACHGKPIGYVEQKLELATILAGAFGWRALARELAGKIPLGGGLIPKAAISFAGTYLVGAGLDRLHRTGQTLNARERRAIYDSAMQKGKVAVKQLVTKVKNRNAA